MLAQAREYLRTNDGSSWSDAFVWLDYATEAAINCPVLEIWVAQGTYTTTFDQNSGKVDERNSSFRLRSGIGLYGGFAGGETERRQANPDINITTLSGDLRGDDRFELDGIEFPGFGDNARSVVTLDANVINPARLDGFTVTSDGAGPGSAQRSNGAAIHNNGGRITATRLRIEGNQPTTGTVYNDAGGVMNLFNVQVIGNNATLTGSGLVNSRSTMTIMNSLIAFNQNRRFAAGLYNFAGTMRVFSSTVTENLNRPGFNGRVHEGAGVFNRNGLEDDDDAVITIFDSTISGNLPANVAFSSGTVSFKSSNVGGSGGSGNRWLPKIGLDLGGNIDRNPRLINAAAENFRLRSNSPLRNRVNTRFSDVQDTSDLDDDGDRREATPDIALVDGDYRWQVQARSIGGIGPLVSTQSESPDFHWGVAADTESYQLRVQSLPSKALLHYENYVAGVNLRCSDSSCIAQAVAMRLKSGKHQWAVMSINKAGRSEWIEDVEFTVEH